MRMRYSLRFVLGVVVVAVALLCGLVRWSYYRPTSCWHDRYATTQAGTFYNFYVMWRGRGPSREFLFVLITPRMVSEYSRVIGGRIRPTIKQEGLDLSHFGMCLDGREVSTDGDEFIYVCTMDKTVRPIVGLTAAEIDRIKAIDEGLQLTQLSVWQQKVEPVIDEEYKRAWLARARRAWGDDVEAQLHWERQQRAERKAAASAGRSDGQRRRS